MRAFIAITLFAALALAGCASNDDAPADSTGGDTNTTGNTTATPTPSPTPAPNCVNPVGPCIEPPSDQ